MANKIWTPVQVLALLERQTCGFLHPYTCPNHGDGNHPNEHDYLVPTVFGWICLFCDYQQYWSHETKERLAVEGSVTVCDPNIAGLP